MAEKYDGLNIQIGYPDKNMAEQRLIDANAIPYVEAVDGDTFKGTGKLYALKEDIDALPTIEKRITGRAVYQAGYAEGYKSAQLERKTGKWIQDTKSKRHRCDQCFSFALKTDDGQENLSDYCPVCGSAMEGE